jgi:Domain of unknown function (DUF6883)
MTVPNADRAIIAADKLTAYLLNMSHKRGAAKARLLLSLGYRSDAAHVLESDLRLSTFRSKSHGRMRTRAASCMKSWDRSECPPAAVSSFVPSGRLTLARMCRDSFHVPEVERGLRNVRRRDLDARCP